MMSEYKNIFWWGVTNAGVTLTVIVPSYTAVSSGQYSEFTLYILLIASTIFVTYIVSPIKKWGKGLKTERFKGAGAPGRENMWYREEERDEIYNIIKQGRQSLFVVGRSGVGKTILLLRQVKPKLQQNGFEVLDISEYRNISDRIKVRDNNIGYRKKKNGEEEVYETGKLVLILDQFERILQSIVDDKDDNTRRWLEDTIERLINREDVQIVISLRKEWYFDLRYLNSYAPSPNKAYHLKGIKQESKSRGGVDIVNIFGKAIDNNELAKRVVGELAESSDRILPVKAQIVGAVLENETNSTGFLSTEKFERVFGTVEACIEKFFTEYIRSSKYPNVTSRVLLALSVDNEASSSYHIKEIRKITQEVFQKVSKSVKYLSQNDLIEKSNNKYRIVHEYISKRYYDVSGDQMDPTDRDNIVYFWSKNRYSTIREYTHNTVDNIKNKRSLAYYALSIIYLILFIRLVYPELYGSDSLADFISLSDQRFVDFGYIPIFISHMAWATYVCIFYRRFLARLKESPFGAALSLSIVITCLFGALAGAVFPNSWILLVGIVGFTVAVKFAHVSLQSHLSSVASKFFRLSALRTFLNISVVSVVGAVFLYYSHNNYLWQSHPRRVLYGFAFVSVVMLYYMANSFNLHCSEEYTSKMVGMYNRSVL